MPIIYIDIVTQVITNAHTLHSVIV